jgi:hypothetical protein
VTGLEVVVGEGSVEVVLDLPGFEVRHLPTRDPEASVEQPVVHVLDEAVGPRADAASDVDFRSPALPDRRCGALADASVVGPSIPTAYEFRPVRDTLTTAGSWTLRSVVDRLPRQSRRRARQELSDKVVRGSATARPSSEFPRDVDFSPTVTFLGRQHVATPREGRDGS